MANAPLPKVENYKVKPVLTRPKSNASAVYGPDLPPGYNYTQRPVLVRPPVTGPDLPPGYNSGPVPVLVRPSEIQHNGPELPAGTSRSPSPTLGERTVGSVFGPESPSTSLPSPILERPEPIQHHEGDGYFVPLPDGYDYTPAPVLIRKFSEATNKTSTEIVKKGVVSHSTNFPYTVAFHTSDNQSWAAAKKLWPVTHSTPTKENDNTDAGVITFDSQYLYIKTHAGWKKVALSDL